MQGRHGPPVGTRRLHGRPLIGDQAQQPFRLIELGRLRLLQQQQRGSSFQAQIVIDQGQGLRIFFELIDVHLPMDVPHLFAGQGMAGD